MMPLNHWFNKILAVINTLLHRVKLLCTPTLILGLGERVLNKVAFTAKR